jgi:hypothetical protein
MAGGHQNIWIVRWMKLVQQCTARLLLRNNHNFSVCKGFEIIELVSAKSIAFWGTATYNSARLYQHLANWYHHFGSTRCPHLVALSKINHSL